MRRLPGLVGGAARGSVRGPVAGWVRGLARPRGVVGVLVALVSCSKRFSMRLFSTISRKSEFNGTDRKRRRRTREVEHAHLSFCGAD